MEINEPQRLELPGINGFAWVLFHLTYRRIKITPLTCRGPTLCTSTHCKKVTPKLLKHQTLRGGDVMTPRKRASKQMVTWNPKPDVSRILRVNVPFTFSQRPPKQYASTVEAIFKWFLLVPLLNHSSSFNESYLPLPSKINQKIEFRSLEANQQFKCAIKTTSPFCLRCLEKTKKILS